MAHTFACLMYDKMLLYLDTGLQGETKVSAFTKDFTTSNFWWFNMKCMNQLWAFLSITSYSLSCPQRFSAIWQACWWRHIWSFLHIWFFPIFSIIVLKNLKMLCAQSITSNEEIWKLTLVSGNYNSLVVTFDFRVI